MTPEEEVLTDELTRRTNSDEMVWTYTDKGVERVGRYDYNPSWKPTWTSGDYLIWTSPGVIDFGRDIDYFGSSLEFQGRLIPYGASLYWALHEQRKRLREFGVRSTVLAAGLNLGMNFKIALSARARRRRRFLRTIRWICRKVINATRRSTVQPRAEGGT